MGMCFGDRTLSISQISEFTEALKLIAEEFLEMCDRPVEFDSNNLFNVIRHFVNNKLALPYLK
ncbi:hypothetical protein [Floridanema evergladense]|uniref:LAGLIDADG homing endonuclease n=1 Tax=Floridaenema evergladense BLCC-F167 TaxID=3153639 RepID=A0ABV4WCT2_9CYAN